MVDIPHPALGQESRRLAMTLKAIDDEVRSLRELGWSGGAVPHATFQARTWAWDKSDRLLDVRSNPYFGRIDVDDDHGQVATFYIGPVGLSGASRGERLIIDWRAPISAAFYRPDERTALRRRIEITDAQITSIFDDYIRDIDMSAVTPDAQADPMLHDILFRARGGQLGSIVRTIQAKQDEIIRTTDSVTVVQGAAGTGKTVIALHRLAYLIYQSRSLGRRDDEDGQPGYPTDLRRITDRSASELKVAVFGPNRTYLRHIRSVLPSLAEVDAVQTTFEEWVLASLTDEGLSGIPSRDDLEDILDSSASREDRRRLFVRARWKGSVKMAQLLTGYVKSELGARIESLRRQPMEIEANVAGQLCTFEVGFPVIDAQARLSGGMPLTQVRQLVRQRMRDDLRHRVQQSLTGRGILGGGAGDDSWRYAQVLGRFDVAFERRWPRYRVVELYRRVLAETPYLQMPTTRAEPDASRMEGETIELGLEDIAPLAYLRLHVHGPIPVRPPGAPDASWTRLDHVVIDEAQDLSPLALTVLRSHADGLTVLGDMNQAIYAHRGTQSWEEALQSLGNGVRQIHTLDPTYRSTRQISELANHVVEVGGLRGGVCRSFPREGPEPQFVGAGSSDHLRDAVITFVNDVCSDQASTVAILTRTAADARSTFDSIADQLSVSAACITDRREAADARVCFMPAYLAKGIEFDAIVVPDADAATYAMTRNDATLLYVAVTRARHRLLVAWRGQPSPLIADRLCGASSQVVSQ